MQSALEIRSKTVLASEQSNEKRDLLDYPNLTHIFGFRYQEYLERKYSAEYAFNIAFTPGEHPKYWFKEMYPYFEKHLTKIGKNTRFTENETEKGNTWR